MRLSAKTFSGYLLTLCSLLPAQPLHEAKPLSPFPQESFQFAGTFDCAGTFGNTKTHKAVFTATTILDGKWLEFTERDVEPQTGYEAKYLIGYDSEHHRLVEFDANNFGAAMYVSAEGWQNHVLTMTSAISEDAKSPYAANRFLYSITGPDTYTVDWQISKTASLKWLLSDHLSCRHRAAE